VKSAVASLACSDSVAVIIHSRADLRAGEVFAAEGRLSAYVLLGLPVGTFSILLLIRPGYVSFFWTTTMGWVLAGRSLLWSLLVWFWPAKTGGVEV
jgi:tight adherence protein B